MLKNCNPVELCCMGLLVEISSGDWDIHGLALKYLELYRKNGSGHYMKYCPYCGEPVSREALKRKVEKKPKDQRTHNERRNLGNNRRSWGLSGLRSGKDRRQPSPNTTRRSGRDRRGDS